MHAQTKDYLARIASSLEKTVAMIRDETAEVVAANDPVALIKHYADVRYEQERIKIAKKALDEVHDQLSNVHVPEALRAAEVKSMTVEGIGRVQVSYRFSCSMLDPEAGQKWLRDNGAASLIKETVNSAALSAFAKTKLEEEGVDLPSEVFKVGSMPYTSIVKK